MQYFSMPLALWFNVGVQMFFILSAILYAQKSITSVSDFLIYRFVRIFPSYFYVAFGFAIAYAVFCHAPLLRNLRLIISLNAPEVNVGLAHLWFIPAILACYLLVPYLWNTCNEVRGKKGKSLLILLIAGLMVLVFFHKWCYPIIAFASAYVFKFFWPTLFSKDESKKTLLIFIPTALLIAVTVLTKNGHANHIAHIFLAYLLCLSLSFFSSYPKWAKAVLDVSDRYSFEFYLIHHIFILGQFSLLRSYTQSLPLFLVVAAIFAVTCVLAFILHQLNKLSSALLLNLFVPQPKRP